MQSTTDDVTERLECLEAKLRRLWRQKTALIYFTLLSFICFVLAYCLKETDDRWRRADTMELLNSLQKNNPSLVIPTEYLEEVQCLEESN